MTFSFAVFAGHPRTCDVLLASAVLASGWTGKLAAQTGSQSTSLFGQPPVTAAGSADSGGTASTSPTVQTAHVIYWYDGAAAIAGVAALMLFDDPVQRTMQDHRSPTSNHLATVFRQAGQPDVFLTVSAGMLGSGILARDPPLTQAGERLLASLGLAGTSALLLKKVIGRARPTADSGAFHFAPFGHDDAMPSGHTTMAFALATSLADDLHKNVWAEMGLYALATGTAWSRLNDNKHWLSDTGLGALIGITATKLVDRRWQVFGLKPPGLLVGPKGTVSIEWHFTS